MARGRNVIDQSIALEGVDGSVAQLRKMGEEGEKAAKKLTLQLRGALGCHNHLGCAQHAADLADDCGLDLSRWHTRHLAFAIAMLQDCRAHIVAVEPVALARASGREGGTVRAVEKTFQYGGRLASRIAGAEPVAFLQTGLHVVSFLLVDRALVLAQVALAIGRTAFPPMRAGETQS